MHVKLKEGMRHVYKVGKITLTMQFSEDSDDEDYVKVLCTVTLQFKFQYLIINLIGFN